MSAERELVLAEWCVSCPRCLRVVGVHIDGRVYRLVGHKVRWNSLKWCEKSHMRVDDAGNVIGGMIDPDVLLELKR